MKFKLVALHVPSQEPVTYGPWEGSADPDVFAREVIFAHGFLCGFHMRQTEGQGEIQDLADFKLETEEGANLAAVFKIEDAEMTVTHADGTTD